jgi:hypothetical protein
LGLWWLSMTMSLSCRLCEHHRRSLRVFDIQFPSQADHIGCIHWLDLVHSPIQGSILIECNNTHC